MASPQGPSLSLSERFCLPAERTSNVFDKAVGQQVQSIVSIATSSSVTSGSEGKSLKAAGTWLLACEEWCNYISLCGEVNREAFGGTGLRGGGRGLPQVTSGQDTVKIHQRHSQENRQPMCTMQALCHWWWSWVIGIWALEGFNKTLLFSLSPSPHPSPAAVWIKALWLIEFKGIRAADVDDVVVARSWTCFWMQEPGQPSRHPQGVGHPANTAVLFSNWSRIPRKWTSSPAVHEQSAFFGFLFLVIRMLPILAWGVCLVLAYWWRKTPAAWSQGE